MRCALCFFDVFLRPKYLFLVHVRTSYALRVVHVFLKTESRPLRCVQSPYSLCFVVSCHQFESCSLVRAQSLVFSVILASSFSSNLILLSAKRGYALSVLLKSFNHLNPVLLFSNWMHQFSISCSSFLYRPVSSFLCCSCSFLFSFCSMWILITMMGILVYLNEMLQIWRRRRIYRERNRLT